MKETKYDFKKIARITSFALVVGLAALLTPKPASENNQSQGIQFHQEDFRDFRKTRNYEASPDALRLHLDDYHNFNPEMIRPRHDEFGSKYDSLTARRR